MSDVHAPPGPYAQSRQLAEKIATSELARLDSLSAMRCEPDVHVG